MQDHQVHVYNNFQIIICIRTTMSRRSDDNDNGCDNIGVDIDFVACTVSFPFNESGGPLSTIIFAPPCFCMTKLSRSFTLITGYALMQSRETDRVRDAAS